MLKNMENHLWVEHGEGSGPPVPHNSPTHKRKSGSNASAKEAPIDVSQTWYDRKAGGVSRKMGVSQPAREKKKERAKSNVNSLNHQFVSSGSVFVIVGYKRPIEHMHTCIHTHACTDTRQSPPYLSQGQLFSREETVRTPPPQDREGSPLIYRERMSGGLPSSAAPPTTSVEQQQEQEKTGEGEEDPNTIPCEDCGKNIPIPEFMDHQVRTCVCTYSHALLAHDGLVQ